MNSIYTSPDKNGFVPNDALIGKNYQHSGNGKTYVIEGFVFFCDTGEWAVVYKDTERSDVVFSRTVANFFGSRSVQRFEEITT